MIERSFVNQKKREHEIQEFIGEQMKNVGMSHAKLVRTPLGEKIIIFTSRPGLVVGKGGENISRLTSQLKKRFSLENPQLEISEVDSPNLDAQIVAERIASSLERFGSKRFKGVIHKALEDVMAAGALGVEIVLAGKVPGARAKRWRVFAGYLKKSGDISISNVKRAMATSKLKSGVIGIKVSIMPDTGISEVTILDAEHHEARAEAETEAEIKEEQLTPESPELPEENAGATKEQTTQQGKQEPAKGKTRKKAKPSRRKQEEKSQDETKSKGS